MGYLFFRDCPPISKKFTLSLWFRVPQTSIDKARKAFAPYRSGSLPSSSMPPMTGIVPLMQFGPSIKRRDPSLNQIVNSITSTQTSWEWYNDPTCAWVSQGDHNIPATFYTTAPPQYISNTFDPSYIGIDCRSDRNVLTFSIGYDIQATVAGLVQEITSYDVPHYDEYGTIGLTSASMCQPPVVYNSLGFPHPSPEVGGLYSRSSTASDISSVQFQRIYNRFSTVGADGSHGLLYGDGDYTGSDTTYLGAGPDVTADHWHQVILSCDLKRVAATGKLYETYNGEPDVAGLVATSYGASTATAKIYLSLDDKNLTRKQISIYNPKDAGANDFLTWGGYYAYRLQNMNDTTFIPDNFQGHSVQLKSTGMVLPKYEFTPPPTPIGDLYIPGTAESTLEVEMAELQIFEDVLIDTALTANRRLFVSQGGKPTPPSVAAEMLGDPLRMLHRSGNWKKANDTGSLDWDGAPIGKIKTYTPNPNLYGEQGV